MPRKHANRSDQATARLLELASLYGIQPSYIDSQGRRQAASEESISAALRVLGSAPQDSLNNAIRSRRRQMSSQVIEPIQIAWDGHLNGVILRLPRSSPFLEGTCKWHFSLTLESGAITDWIVDSRSLQTDHDSISDSTVLAHLPFKLSIEMGYHDLGIEGFTQRSTIRLEATVISAPERCYAHPGSRNSWGVFLPLYALRSRQDWGTGDFAALKRLHQWIGSLGASWTGTLPLLSTFLDHPFEPSPYMPVSRRYWNELFVCPQAEPEFAESRAVRKLTASPGWKDALRLVHRSQLVEYREAMRLKRRVLEQMAEQLYGADTARAESFRKFLAEHPDLADYARFRAVQEKRGTNWTQWPSRMRDGVLSAADSDPKRERYHQYVQWLAASQLASIGNGDSQGGLYLDFPLGVHPYGYDVWRNQDLFVRNASTGAPPDDLFPDGQNWGFPPLHPEAIRKSGYRYLRECLRHQMRYAKLLRIDHVMGLNRLYWIPDGIATSDGVYLEYRAEEMYAVLSLESHRAQTTVVGENLGTVPKSVTKAMKRHNTLGMHILQFSVSPTTKRTLLEPRRKQVASLNTHDTPMFAGFLQGSDIRDFQRLGIFSRETARLKLQQRQQAIAKLAERFRLKGLEKRRLQQRLLARCLEWLSESQAKIVMMNLEDIWLEPLPQNIPGTGPGTKNPDQPNWRRKARRTLEQVFNDAATSRMLRQAFRSRNASSKRHV